MNKLIKEDVRMAIADDIKHVEVGMVIEIPDPYTYLDVKEPRLGKRIYVVVSCNRQTGQFTLGPGDYYVHKR